MPLIAGTTETPASAATASTNGTSVTSANGASGALDNMGSDAFMKLLVAQMRYQNPMSPTDGTQYLAQVSQYAMVEQLQKVNKSQQEISAYQRSMIANSFIGKMVAGIGEAGTPVTGQVLGVAFQAGRPVLVTTGGELAVDKVDEARLSTAPLPTTPADTTTPAESTTPATTPAATSAATTGAGTPDTGDNTSDSSATTTSSSTSEPTTNTSTETK